MVKAKSVHFPVPLGGMNVADARHSVEGTKQGTDALLLENVIYQGEGLSLRGGLLDLITLPLTVQSLFNYSGYSNSVLFAATSDKIYKINTHFTPVAYEDSGAGDFTSGDFRSCSMVTGAGLFLFACNGADNPVFYDGSAWSDASISGFDASNAVAPVTHKARIWLVEKDAVCAWYLGTNSITGTANKFNFSFRRGGYLMALASWTRDGGAGADDYLVAISSEGDVALYAGTDPASSTTWGLVGVYQLAKPVCRDCFLNVGADLLVLTSAGLISLTNTLAAPVAGQKDISISRKIFPLLSKDMALYKNWRMTEYPQDGVVILNIAYSATFAYQYVVNVTSGAWTVWNTNCTNFCLHDGKMYFSASTSIGVYGETFNDNGAAIIAKIQLGYSALRGTGKKRATTAKCYFDGDLFEPPRIKIAVDYSDADFAGLLRISSADGIAWDNITWDESFWGAFSEDDGIPWDNVTWDESFWGASARLSSAKNQAYPISGYGNSLSPYLVLTGQGFTRFNGVDVYYESGMGW